MKKVFLMMTAFCVMLTLVSCGSEDEEQKDVITTKNELIYRFYTQNEGDLPKIGDVIEFTWASTLNDSIVLIPVSENMLLLMEPQFENDIMGGLAMMHIGDSASFSIDAETVFTKMFGYPNMVVQILLIMSKNMFFLSIVLKLLGPNYSSPWFCSVCRCSGKCSRL